MTESAPDPVRPERRLQLFITAGAALLAAGIVGLYLFSASRTNHEALAQSPKPVATVKATAATFRSTRSYVGTTYAWTTARVGPQYVSAYVGTVLVRPGAAVKRGQVLATLDCRNASAASREIAARAKAVEERQAALEHEAARTRELTAGGFASENEVEQLAARSASQKAEVDSLKASMVGRGLEVDDCVLRAPFDGEVADRLADPGAYVRPGSPVVTVIDRSTLRIAADAPEHDFAAIAPGTVVQIEIEATGAKTSAAVARRAPAADEVTRTVHFEIDVPNGKRELPAGATARLLIEVGEPQPASVVPLRVATLRGEKASVFTVAGGVAHRSSMAVLGDRDGQLYLPPAHLPTGTDVVIEGRALLEDGDPVTQKAFAP